MRTHSRYTSKNGRAYATVVIGGSNRISVHLSVNQNKRWHATYSLTAGQLEAALVVLGKALADTTLSPDGRQYPRHTADSGRARAQLRRDLDDAVIWLTISQGSERFYQIPLDIRDAEAIFSCGFDALRDARALLRSLHAEGA